MRISGRVLTNLGAAVILLSSIVILSSCEQYKYTVETVNPADTVYFQAEIQPLFTSKCITCHGTIRDPDLRIGHSYESLTSGGFVNLPGESSLLYSKLTSGSHASYVSEPERQKILYWIEQGAANN